VRIAVLATLACACGRVGFDPVAAAHRRPIAVATGQTGTLSDFPVGVIVAADAALARGARPDGRDLAFSDGATPLSFEIESYDGTTGALVAWVRVPSLPMTTTLYLSYGGALDLQDPPGTWPGCLGVWHLGDSGSANDSVHGHTLDPPGGARAPATVTGIAGGARDFVDAGTLLSIANPPDRSLDMGTRSYSVSMWVNVNTSIGMFDMPMYKGGGDATTPGYDVEIGTSAWRTDIGDGTTANYAMFTTVRGAWVHLVGVADRSTQTLSAYTDAVLSDSISIATIGSIDSPQPLGFGDVSNPFVGVLDELRIYDHGLTPAWIAAEYRNLTDPSFAVLGPE
jgi:MSHA biogenesis protein MshQ